MRGTNTIALDPRIMRQVGLELADGQIEQADRWLLVAAGNEKPPTRPQGGYMMPPEGALVEALLHLRSACGWLQSAARTADTHASRVARRA